MGISTEAWVVMVGAVGSGEAGGTIGPVRASKPETWAAKLASFGPDEMGVFVALVGSHQKTRWRKIKRF